MDGTKTVGACIATADDDDALALGSDGRTLRSRGTVEPPASTVASNSRVKRSAAKSTPTLTPARKITPSCSRMERRRSRNRFSSLK
jgi:hypothetical protein